MPSIFPVHANKVFEEKCTTVNKVHCAPGAQVGRRRKKRGVVQAALLNNALNQRHPTRAPVTTAPLIRVARPALISVCIATPETRCEKVAVEKPEIVCKEVEGEKNCSRGPKREKRCREVSFKVPKESCSVLPNTVCVNKEVC